jgi:hypothetical protein
MAETKWDNSVDPVYPVNRVDDKIIIDPEGVIQLALSKYRRDTDFSDNRLSEYICELLSLVMDSNNVIINQNDVTKTSTRFRILTFEEAKYKPNHIS